MSWFIENWFIVLGLLAVLVAVFFAVKIFWGLPTAVQIAKIKEWMLWAVTKAEAELGAGNGDLKLRFVYDLFISRFPLVAKAVSFETFKLWVDDALDRMKELLAVNKMAAAFVAPIDLEFPPAEDE